MARPRTGSVTRHGDHFDIRITLPDGSRSKPMCQPPEHERGEGPRQGAAPHRARHQGGAPGVTEAQGEGSGGARRRDLRRVVGAMVRRPRGARPDQRGGRPRAAARSGCSPRSARARWSRSSGSTSSASSSSWTATCAPELPSWKTARNVWGTVSKMFDDACRSKTLALRVLTDQPAARACAAPTRA